LSQENVPAVLTAAPRSTDTTYVESGEDTIEPANKREGGRRRRLLPIAVGGVVVGVVTALRLVDRWGAGGAAGDRRIPTGGLIYFGAFFIFGGLLFLLPRYWHWQADRSTWSGKTVFGTMPPREALPWWRQALWDLQEWLIARDGRHREAMRRDPRPYQLRASAVGLAAGITLLLYAALR
jgi:hypothetical protein